MHCNDVTRGIHHTVQIRVSVVRINGQTWVYHFGITYKTCRVGNLASKHMLIAHIVLTMLMVDLVDLPKETMTPLTI